MRLVVEPRIFDCFPGLHLAVAEAMRRDMVSGLEEHFEVEATSVLLDSERPALDIDTLPE